VKAEDRKAGPFPQKETEGTKIENRLSRGEAALRFQQAAKAHLEALLETGRPIPSAFRDKFVLAA